VIKTWIVTIQPGVDHTLHRNAELALAASSAVAATVTGDRLRREVRENYGFLWRSLRRLGVAYASVEDAAQQVLVVFARRIGDVRPGAERAFLFATATRVAADFRNKQRRSLEFPASEDIDAHASSSPSAEQLIDQGRARELFDLVLAELPVDLRAVFSLFELEQMTMANIAETLELRPGTVASRLRRARAMFESTANRMQRVWRPR
jgi:RNA polymerase sigma-70 factor (ECF subfamily)